jgi:membrane protein
MGNPIATAKSGVATARQRRPFLDHLVRAYTRYQADGGDRLAASVTYFGFLSFFPLIALAFSVAGFVVDAYPDAQDKLTQQINTFLPGLADKLDVTTIGHAKVATGLVGLVGLLLAGLGWIDALREAIRTVWHHNVQAGNFIVKKLVDIGVLAGLGLTLIGSVAVTGVSSAAMSWFLDLLGINHSIAARIGLRVVGIALALLVDTALFLFLFTRLPRLRTPYRKVIKGAVLGAVGFEVLKVVGSVLVARTTKNPVYGAFAVVVGLLIWINLVSRFLLLTAAWTVTAPYDTDVEPSGTASQEAAEQAGIPQQYADHDPDDVPTTGGGGSPAPLAAALQGETPPQDQAEGREDQAAERGREGAGQAPTPQPDRTEQSEQSERTERTDRTEPGGERAGTPPTTHARMVASEASLRTAGRVGAGVLVAGVASAALYGAKVFRDSGSRDSAGDPASGD